MNAPVLFISRVKDCNTLHFNGYWQGEKIECIRAINHNLPVGTDQMIWGLFKGVEDGEIFIKILKHKEIK